MKGSFLERAAQFLTKQRRHSYWLAAVACLALAVMTGTVYSLIRQGQASVYMEKTLACPVTVHVHGADCYGEAGQLICGYADYVVHTHNDDCYDADGQLVCQLGEAEEHIHDESCWTTERVLVCPLEETGSHQHTDACYAHCPLAAMPDHQHTEACSAPGPCPLEEHVHTDACYEWVTEESLSVTSESASPEAMAGENALPAEDSGIPSFLEPQQEVQNTEPVQEPQPEIPAPQPAPDPQPETPAPQPTPEPQPQMVRKLICGKVEHTHSNQCQWLACGQEDGAVGHVHTDVCYEERQVLSCGKNELHTHTPECYENGQLICGKLEVRSHVHDENCFRVHKLDEDEVTNLTPGGDPETPDVPETPEGHVHGPECYGPAPLICTEEEHTHTESCYTAETREVPVMLEDGTVTTELQEVTVLTCTKTEHTHTDACYAGERTLICGLEETLPSTPEDPSQTPETPEVPDTPDVPGVPADPNAPHHHTDACYAPMDPICGLEEHAHGGDCIKSDTLEYICGKIEHTHTDECYPEPRTLICGLEEGQIPGEETPEEKPVEQPVEMGTWFTAATVENDSQMTQAIVRCTAEAGIPADAELHIRRVEDGAELDSQARQAREITGQMGMEEVELSFYDIGFTWQGQEIEPKVPVTVELHWFGADAQEISATTAMIHYGSSGPEVVDHYLVEDGVVFETDGFSNYAVVKKARAATSSNLAGFTTGVTITAANGDVITIDSSGNATAKDKDGNPIAATDIKIYVGETYKVNVSFAEVADGNISHQFDPSGMTYQIPGVLSCNAVTNMPLNVGDKQIGTYSIDTTGKLTVTLTDNDFIASQTAKMNIEFDATAVKNSQSQQEGFDFGNNVNVNIEVRNEAQVEVEKYAHTFDPATRTIEYDITAKVVKGSVTELELKDYLDDTKGYYKVIDNTLTVKDLDGRELTGYTVEKTFHGNGTFSRPEGNVHSSKEVTTVKISGGDGFKAGEGVKLNYKVEVQESFFAQNPGSSIITGSVMNQVNLTGKKDGTPVTDYDRVEKSFKATRLDKKYEEVDGKIKWTVRIGDGKMALKDQSVTDTLKADSGMTYDKSIPIQLIPIKLVKDSVEERSNHPTTYQWDDDNITSDDSSFTIRKLPAPRDDYNAFELVYYTTKGTGFDPNKNEVSIGGITASGGGTPAIVKTGEDNKNGTLEYKIEVTVPAGFQGKPVWIDDALKCTTMSGAPGFNNPVPEDLKVTVTPEGGNAVTFTAGRTTNNNSYTYYIRQSGSSYKFYIGFSVGNTDKNEDKTVNEKDGSWPFSEAATITVTYSVSTDNVLVEGDETTTVEGALSGNYVVGNRARFYYASDKYKEANKDIARIQEISKSGEQMKDGTIHYVVNFPNGANKNIHVLPADTSDIWLDDTFDSRLEYVEGSLKMYFYDKNDPSDISNMYFVYGKDGKNNPLIGSGHIKVSAKDFYRIKILETDKDGKPTKTETRPDQDFIYQFISESTTRYKNKSIRFEYDLKPKDGVFSTVDGQTTVTLNNEAKMSWIGSSDTSGKPTESAPARSSVEYNVGVLDKWGEQDERPGYNDTLHYTIELNRAGLELGKNGTYDVTDTMSADLAVMVDTVKVEKCENGNWTELTKGTDYTVSFSEQGGEQVMTFTDLPDETHLRITYDTRIKGTAGSANVSNTAVLKGSTTYSTVDTASYDINRNQSEAWYELKKILLVKQDALNTEIKLSDAVFALYTENESYTGSEPPAGVQDKTILVPVNGEQRTLYFRGLYTTDSNGEVWIGNGGEGDQPLTPKVLYALVEVTPPAGYVKSTKRTYFYVGEKSSNSPLENAKIVTSGGFLTISNTPTGYELPETGSDGSMTYVALGALLLCGGGLLAARRGRKRRA